MSNYGEITPVQASGLHVSKPDAADEGLYKKNDKCSFIPSYSGDQHPL